MIAVVLIVLAAVLALFAPRAGAPDTRSATRGTRKAGLLGTDAPDDPVPPDAVPPDPVPPDPLPPDPGTPYPVPDPGTPYPVPDPGTPYPVPDPGVPQADLVA